MKASKLIIAAALTSLIAGATPVLAQSYNGPHGVLVTQRHELRNDNLTPRLNARVSELRERLDQGLQRRQLTRTEFRRLNNDLNVLSADIRNASRGIRAIDRRQFDRFDGRLDRVEAKIRFERHDNDYRPRR